MSGSDRDTFISVMIIDIARQVLTPPREEGAEESEVYKVYKVYKE